MKNKYWLSTNETSLLCNQLGLPRSTKSIRRWCAKGDIEAEKRPTSNGEKWFINRESLEIKIKEELEFLRQSERSFSQPANMPIEQDTDMSTHDRTGSDVSGHEQTRANKGAQVTGQGADVSSSAKIRELENKVLILETDLKWRNEVIQDQKQANEKLLDEVKAQSRYIGHVETQIIKLGGHTDQAFLAAPVPNSGRSEGASTSTETVDPEVISQPRPHPDQGKLYTG